MIAVPRGTEERLRLLKGLILDEATRQNLISLTTVADIDVRHIGDSLQLLDYLPDGAIVDIGSGGGFPGLVLACCRADVVHLVEPRAKRAAFLRTAVEQLKLENTTVWACRVEQLVMPPVAAITARAVGSLDLLLSVGQVVADRQTRWVLPKGRSAQSELDTARLSWQGEFELVSSATDPEARIVLASNVHRRRKA